MVKAKKGLLIGIDNILPGIVERFVKEGYLPNFAELMKNGVYAHAIPSIPLETGTNWATIATGADPMTHGCAYTVNLPNGQHVSGFPSYMCKAEQLWTAAERVGKRSILFDYPQSYPINAKTVIHVGEDGCPDIYPNREISFQMCYNTGKVWHGPPVSREIEYLPSIKIKPANGWKGEILSRKPPLETELTVEQRVARTLVIPEGAGSPVTFPILIIDRQGRGYDEVIIARSKDLSTEICRVHLGEWSDWIVADYTVKEKKVEGVFRLKLLELSLDGKNVKIFRTEVYPHRDFAYPQHIADELLEVCGPFLHRPYMHSIIDWQWLDWESYLQSSEQQTEWFAKAANYLMGKYPWDLFMCKWHGPDHLNHAAFGYIDPISFVYDPKKADAWWKYFGRYYQLGDTMTGKILDNIDLETSVVIVVSDHGALSASARYSRISPRFGDALEKAGLTVYKTDARTGQKVIDVTKSKALSIDRVNLKGRDPHGIVEPGEEYEAIRDQMIDILRGFRDPETGRHVIGFAWRKEDAVILGVGGPYQNDIIHVIEPLKEKWVDKREFEQLGEWGNWISRGATHGHNMPTMHLSIGEGESVFIMAGAGVKKGYRRQKPIWLRDVAPTMAYIMDIPIPKDSDGRVIWDALV